MLGEMKEVGFVMNSFWNRVESTKAMEYSE